MRGLEGRGGLAQPPPARKPGGAAACQWSVGGTGWAQGEHANAQANFRSTGLERVAPLETDIQFMMAEYGLARPPVGKPGKEYAEVLRQTKSIPEFICHYYNHYFAHTAGGRMIGKQISALLLDKTTLEFYKVNMDVDDANALAY